VEKEGVEAEESKGEVGDRHAGGEFAGACGQFAASLIEEVENKVKATGVSSFGSIDAVVKHKSSGSIDELFMKFDGADGCRKLGAQEIESE
jgi:hypothetical protein